LFFAPLAAGAGVASSARMALCVEPALYDAVERLEPLDIREMAGLADLLIAGARSETGETADLAR
jgi:hypothetical protein